MSGFILYPPEPPVEGMVRQKTLFPITNKFAIKPIDLTNLTTFIPPFTGYFNLTLGDEEGVYLHQYFLGDPNDLRGSWAYRLHPRFFITMCSSNLSFQLQPVFISISKFSPPSGPIPFNINNHNTDYVSSAVFGSVGRVLTVTDSAIADSLEVYNLFNEFNGRFMNASSPLIGQYDCYCIVDGGAIISRRFDAWRDLPVLEVSTVYKRSDSEEGGPIIETFGGWFKIFTVTITPI